MPSVEHTVEVPQERGCRDGRPGSVTDAARQERERGRLLPFHARRTFGPEPGSSAGDAGVDTTLELVRQAQAGSQEAVDRLCRRALPPLRTWARGRLPGFARDLRDTDDLVQDTFFQTLRRLSRFEPRHRGALQAYMRLAVTNRIRDEVRRAGRRPTGSSSQELPDAGASPLDAAIGSETADRYRRALGRLRDDDRRAVVARVEEGCGYPELARRLGKPSADAARMAVSRALVRLACEMNRA